MLLPAVLLETCVPLVLPPVTGVVAVLSAELLLESDVDTLLAVDAPNSRSFFFFLSAAIIATEDDPRLNTDIMSSP